MSESNVKGTAALAKGLNVIQTIGDASEPMTAVQIAEANNLPLPTLQRILSSLRSNGYIVREPGKRTYKLGLKVLTWAQNTWENMDVRVAAEAELQRLRDETGEAIQLAMLAGASIVTIDRYDGFQPISLYSSVGKVGPIYCTATGKAILAWQKERPLAEILARIEFVQHTENTIPDADNLRLQLKDIAKQGYSVDNQEHQIGVNCIAAPIFNFRGQVVAATSITAPEFRIPLAKLIAHVPLLKEATEMITRKLGGNPPKVKKS